MSINNFFVTSTPSFNPSWNIFQELNLEQEKVFLFFRGLLPPDEIEENQAIEEKINYIANFSGFKNECKTEDLLVDFYNLTEERKGL